MDAGLPPLLPRCLLFVSSASTSTIPVSGLYVNHDDEVNGQQMLFIIHGYGHTTKRTPSAGGFRCLYFILSPLFTTINLHLCLDA